MDLEEQKVRAASWFAELRDKICSAFEDIEGDYQGDAITAEPGRFERKSWKRDVSDGSDGGGMFERSPRGRIVS